MNIIITLPLYLWLKIAKQEKTIEIRCFLPRYFNRSKSRVYVCVKGTNAVYGYFEVERFEHVTFPFSWYAHNGKAVGVPYPWFRDYAESHKKVFAWHIRHAVEFDTPYDLQQHFYTARAPQSFVYITKNL